MATEKIELYKSLSSVPTPYIPNAMYCVRVGVGIDIYVANSTGSAVHKHNDTTGIVTPRILPASKGFVSSTAEQVIARWAIPANTFNSVLDSLLINMGVQCAGAGTFIYRLRIGANGNTTDTQVVLITTSATQVINAYHSIEFLAGFHNSLTAMRANGKVQAQAAVLGTVTGTALTATVNQTSVIQVSVTCQTSTAQVATVIAPSLIIGG